MIKIKQSEDGLFYFVLTGKNGKVLMTSETYANKRNVRRAVEAFENLTLGHDLILVKDETE